MKRKYYVVSAPMNMQPKKVYGAEICDLQLLANSIKVGVKIFARKNRKSKKNLKGAPKK